MSDRLVIRRGNVDVAVLPLSEGSFEIGSAPANGLCLPDPAVRPFHWVLRRRMDRWYAVPRGVPVGRGGRDAGILMAGGRWIEVGPYRVRIVGGAGPRVAVHDRTRPTVRGGHGPLRGIVLRFILRGELRYRTIEEGRVLMGRSRRCEVELDDPTVSERHARIVVEAGGATVEDLASLNGTFLDGRRVQLAEIGEAGVLRLGRTEVDFRARSAEAVVPPSARPLCTPGLRSAFDAVRRAAGIREPVLLLGESGSGKEVLARTLHGDGPRRAGPFVAVNCGALPRDLAESILIGHQRGAFTGAAENRRGAFSLADGGTLFLDEIGETPPDVQAKLLRAVEEREIRPLGSERAVPVDVRLVAATLRNLAVEVRAGRFRRDLYHRLSVLVVHVPPLRERLGDIEPLASVLLGALEADLGPRRLGPAALRKLRTHDWPGNVRELRNVLVRAAFDSPGDEIDPERIRFEEIPPDRLPRIVRREPAHLEAALDACDWNIAAAARSLGMPRTTLRDWVLARNRGRDAQAANAG